MSGRECRSAPPAVGVDRTLDDGRLEPEVAAVASPEHAVLALDDATALCRVEYLSDEPWVGGHRLDAVDCFGDVDSVLGCGEEVDAEFDPRLAVGRERHVVSLRARTEEALAADGTERNGFVAPCRPLVVSWTPGRSTRLVGAAAAVVLVAAVLTDAGTVLRRLSWLAADPVRFTPALVAFALVRPLFGWPATLVGVAAGYGFGPAGAPVAVALLGVTALPPYLFARRVGAPAVPDDGRVDRVLSAAERVRTGAGDYRTVTAARLLPAPSDAISLAAGAGGVPLRPFLVGTLVGEGPWAVAGALAGVELGSLAAGTGLCVDARLVVVAVGVAGLLVAGPAYRAYAGSRG